MKKILVIDDDPGILEITTLILDFEGYEVLPLINPHHANEKVSEFKPDLIILDVMLGDIDGRDLCQNLKMNPNTQHIPIIMFSAVHDFRSVMDKDILADDFIAKPFDVDIIVTKVKRLIRD